MNDSYFNELTTGAEMINNIDELVEDNYHKGVHDKIVKVVVDRLEETGLYETIKHNVPYHNNYRREYGEADILAKAGNRYFAFEIKSTFKKQQKALEQLDRDERLIKDCFTRECVVHKFHVYSKGKGEHIKIDKR